MDKKPLIIISICVVALLILASLSNVAGYQTVQSSNQKSMNTYDDVDIDIHAGIYDKTNGNYGLGYVISLTNNLFNKIVKADVKIYYNNTLNKTVSFTNLLIDLVPLFVIRSQFVSRSGIEIGSFVFFSDEIIR